MSMPRRGAPQDLPAINDAPGTAPEPWPPQAAVSEIVNDLPRDELRARDWSEACAIVQQTLHGARRWAKYYQSRRRQMIDVARNRQEAVGSIPSVIKHLHAIEKVMRTRLRALEEPLAPVDHPLHPAELKKLVQNLSVVQEQLGRFGEECGKPVPGVKGRSSDAWRLGFIWAMAMGWKELTHRPCAARGFFERFVQNGFKLLKPDDTGPDDWRSLIETAQRRFCLDDEKPLRPGDDLALFPVEPLR
jgi:hypothetical protein